MKISNVPVIGKVLMVLAAFGLFTVGSTMFATTQMAQIDADYTVSIDNEGTAALSLVRSNRAFAQLGAAMANLLISNTDAGNQLAAANFDKARSEMIDRFTKAKAALPAKTADIDALQTLALGVVDGPCARTLSMARAATAPEAILASQQEYLDHCSDALPPVKDAITSVANATVDSQAAETVRLGELTRQTIMTTYAIVLGGLLAVLVCGFFAVRSWISSPLKTLAGRMEELALGRLDVAVDGQTRRDEVGLMARAVQVFKENALRARVLEGEASAARALAETEAGRTEGMRRKTEGEQKLVVSALAGGLSRVAEGDLTTRLDQAFPEDYRQLQGDFNAAVDTLRQTLSAVGVSVRGMKAQTDEIATASDDMSRRTEQQAASLEETAAALNEITQAIRQTADSAKQAADVTALARAGAEKSGAVVRQAVAAMGEIEQSSEKIGKIIGVIDEIAFQTNLLALNAGVEAARAGEAGRGFAVVAQEVRGLAQRSAEAAKEIKELISSSSQQVGQGVGLVAQTGTALDRMAEQVAELAALVTGIAASAKEQATGLHEVNAAVNQMDQVTQQNAAMVEQSTAANRALAGEADDLTGLMAKFRTGEETSSHAGPQRRAASAATPARRPARPAAAPAQRQAAAGTARKLELVAEKDEWESSDRTRAGRLPQGRPGKRPEHPAPRRRARNGRPAVGNPAFR